MQPENTPYSLIAKHFAGQSNAFEEAQLDEWISHSPSNQSRYQQLKQEWESVHKAPIKYIIPNKEKVWSKIREQIHQKKLAIPTYTRTTLIRVASVAAIICLLIGGTLTNYMVNQINENKLGQQATTITSPPGQKSQLVLPDGSKVWLNAGSSLTYSANFNQTNRYVKLEGEAHFDVQKNKKNRFIVSTGKVNIEVYGTAFNVSSYNEDPQLSVTLERGSVQLTTANTRKPLATLVPNQTVSISKADLQYRISTVDAAQESIWRFNKLKFENATTAQVLKKLARWYGVSIQCENPQTAVNYWFTIKTETLTEILASINKLTPIKYTINGEEVHINYK